MPKGYFLCFLPCRVIFTPTPDDMGHLSPGLSARRIRRNAATGLVKNIVPKRAIT